MIWIKNKKLKIILTSLITLTVLLSPLFDCFGIYYAEEFPTEIGLSGGYFIRFKNTSTSDFVVLIPDNYINSFAFQGNGTLINTTTSTISTRLFNVRAGTVISARFTALNGLEYYSNQTWNSMSTYTITDMNIYPKSDNPLYCNQNLHLDYNTKYLIIFISVATILLLVFRRSEKYG